MYIKFENGQSTSSQVSWIKLNQIFRSESILAWTLDTTVFNGTFTDLLAVRSVSSGWTLGALIDTPREETVNKHHISLKIWHYRCSKKNYGPKGRSFIPFEFDLSLESVGPSFAICSVWAWSPARDQIQTGAHIHNFTWAMADVKCKQMTEIHSMDDILQIWSGKCAFQWGITTGLTPGSHATIGHAASVWTRRQKWNKLLLLV